MISFRALNSTKISSCQSSTKHSFSSSLTLLGNNISSSKFNNNTTSLITSQSFKVQTLKSDYWIRNSKCYIHYSNWRQKQVQNQFQDKEDKRVYHYEPEEPQHCHHIMPERGRIPGPSDGCIRNVIAFSTNYQLENHFK
eukprot:gb/GECH01012659.1/.p1 GENE.gb/GECH01012659.1/~~gb/GECH01012659.1/.p1  ORF type:complete len:139 (+),score=31.47 gb/GECH01012659.1/:1-417(+)